MSAVIEPAARIWTEAEIQALPDDGYIHEVVNGELVHPEEQFIELCHSLTDRQLLGPGGSLAGEHLLPGFAFPVADLFKGWEW